MKPREDVMGQGSRGTCACGSKAGASEGADRGAAVAPRGECMACSQRAGYHDGAIETRVPQQLLAIENDGAASNRDGRGFAR